MFVTLPSHAGLRKTVASLLFAAGALFTSQLSAQGNLPCTGAPIFFSGGAYNDGGSADITSINNPNGFHEVNAGGGTVVFDGHYYVQTPLLLVNGDFVFKPGTRMYFSSSTPGHNNNLCPQYGADPELHHMEVQDARIILDNATFASDGCNRIWGGIYLVGNSEVKTFNAHITEAHIGLALSRGCTGSNDNRYWIEQSTFTDNSIGFWDSYRVAQGDGIVNSTFRSSNFPLPLHYPNGTSAYALKGMYFENDANNVVHDYTNAIFYGNQFRDMVQYGMHGNANIHIDNCKFERIGNTAIRFYNDIVSSTARISNCTIDVPNTPYGAPYGVGTISGIQFAPFVQIDGTTITGLGTLPSNVGGQKTVGVWMNSNNPLDEKIHIFSSQLINLQEGILVNNPAKYKLTAERNWFIDNLRGIHLRNSTPALFAEFYTNCNTFVRNNIVQQMWGLSADQGTWFRNQQGVGGGGAACGNSFNQLQFNFRPVVNIGTNTAFRYYGYVHPEENLPAMGGISGNPGNTFMPVNYPGFTPCTGTGAGVQREAAPEQADAEQLGQSYPNPATDVATIPYQLPAGVSTAVIEIKELVTGRMVGRYNVSADATELQVQTSALSSGSYVYSLQADGAVLATKKLVVIK